VKKSVGKYSKFSLKGNVLSHTDSFVSTSEAMLWIETGLREVAPDVAVSARIKALYIVALIASHLGQSDLLFVRARECLALARQHEDSRGFAIASWPLVHHLLADGDMIGAHAQAEETLTVVRAHAPAADSWTLACALNAFRQCMGNGLVCEPLR